MKGKKAMGFDIMSGNDRFPVGSYWWVTLANYSRHIAPTHTAACRHWDSNDGDGLSADQARQLGAELQRSVDDCGVDAYARQLFAMLYKENSVPSWARTSDELFDRDELPRHEQERRFVNEFVSEVQRFIAFLLTCKGFAIL
jgi:hypothetical protein